MIVEQSAFIVHVVFRSISSFSAWKPLNIDILVEQIFEILHTKLQTCSEAGKGEAAIRLHVPI